MYFLDLASFAYHVYEFLSIVACNYSSVSFTIERRYHNLLIPETLKDIGGVIVRSCFEDSGTCSQYPGAQVSLAHTGYDIPVPKDVYSQPF